MRSLEREIEIRAKLMSKYSQVLRLLSKYEEAPSIEVELGVRTIKIRDANNLQSNKYITISASDVRIEGLIQQLIRRMQAKRAREPEIIEGPLI